MLSLRMRRSCSCWDRRKRGCLLKLIELKTKSSNLRPQLGDLAQQMFNIDVVAVVDVINDDVTEIGEAGC